MATSVTMQNQLVDLSMVIARNDPLHVEAEMAFAAMVARIMHEAGTETVREFTEQPTGSMAGRIMFGTAEAYDALAHDASGP